MISRKASYKAFTNIPARRKPVPTVPPKKEEKNDTWDLAVSSTPSEPQLPVAPVQSPQPLPVEKVHKNEFIKPNENIEKTSKPSFIRRIVPPVHLPIRKVRSVLVTSDRTDESQKEIEAVSSADKFVHSKAAESSQSESESELSMLPTSPAKPRIVRPSPMLRLENEGKRPLHDSEDPPADPLKMLMFKRKRPKTTQFARKMAEARRTLHTKFKDGVLDRSAMTMFDFIYYNPPTNPMKSNNVMSKKVDEIIEKVGEQTEQEKLLDEEKEEQDLLNEIDDEGSMPAPRVKIGANGEIILDEKSVIIETSDAKKARGNIYKPIVIDNSERKLSHYSMRRKRGKDWSPNETKFFYKALNTIGTDFSMMLTLFPDRSRRDLKNKFKHEERINESLVKIALGQPSHFNITKLKEDLEKERLMIEEKKKKILEEKEAKERNRERDSSSRRHRKSRPRYLDNDINESDSENEDVTIGMKRRISNRIKNSATYKRLLGYEEENESEKSQDEEMVEEERECRTDVTDRQFVQLLDRNLKSLNQATIRVQVDGSAKIQLIMDNVTNDILRQFEKSDNANYVVEALDDEEQVQNVDGVIEALDEESQIDSEMLPQISPSS